MLILKAIMNSPVADVFAFKTCCGVRAFDQNLEILVTNPGPDPVTVPSRCDLLHAAGTTRIETLMPHGDRIIAPGATIAFYCTMDEDLWAQGRRLVFHDSAGRRHELELSPDPKE